MLLGEAPSGIASAVDDVVVSDALSISEPVIARELPNSAVRVEPGGEGHAFEQRDVFRHNAVVSAFPARAIQDRSTRHQSRGATLRRVLAKCRHHCLAVTTRQDDATALALLGQIAPKVSASTVR